MSPLGFGTDRLEPDKPPLSPATQHGIWPPVGQGGVWVRLRGLPRVYPNAAPAALSDGCDGSAGEEHPISVKIENRAMNQNLGIVLLAAALAQAAVAQSPVPAGASAELLTSGKALFLEKCAFCHGPDTAGGESGPDLTRSTLVAGDVGGNRIGPVVHDGRPQAGMPAFSLSEPEISAIVAFIHNQKTMLEKKGGRRGVDDADLQTGNAETGKKYFNGAGKCASCHSPTGDLAGIATRFKGLKLEQRMLNPETRAPR